MERGGDEKLNFLAERDESARRLAGGAGLFKIAKQLYNHKNLILKQNRKRREIMKKFLMFFCLIALVLAVGGPANALILFEDNFETAWTGD